MDFAFIFNQRKKIKPAKLVKNIFLLDVNDDVLLEHPPLAKVSDTVKGELDDTIIDDTIMETTKEKPTRDHPRDHKLIKVSPFYLNNRKKFVQKINDLYFSYKKEYANILKNGEDETKTPESERKFELMTHQKLVRDYLSINTPYRGLLLFFALGSGKTCSSIAIAEGLKSHKHVFIMTPASLSANYLQSLKECGDPVYKLKQHWKHKKRADIKTKEELNEYASKYSLPIEYIEKRGIWLATLNAKTPASPNFASLSQDEKRTLNEQIDIMIDAKYSFVNFNGNRANNWKKLSKKETINPFNDSVLIIDEVHMFIGEIASILQQKNHINHPTYKMYKAIMTAEDARIVLLTGTPIVNKPSEIAIMFNMLRGILRSWVFKIPKNVSVKFDDKIVQRILEKNEITTYDYYKFNSINNTLTITRNPYGFIRSVDSKGQYNGVILNENGEITNDEFEKQLKGILEQYINGENGGKQTIKLPSAELKEHLLFEHTDEDFNAMFIDAETRTIKNRSMFEINTLGLTSYYTSPDERLLPRTILPSPDEIKTVGRHKGFLSADLFKDYNIEIVPMSEYQVGIYSQLRTSEISKERKKQRNNPLAEFQKFSTSYRLDSRTACNFVFPKEVPKPNSKVIHESVIKSRKVLGGSSKTPPLKKASIVDEDRDEDGDEDRDEDGDEDSDEDGEDDEDSDEDGEEDGEDDEDGDEEDTINIEDYNALNELAKGGFLTASELPKYSNKYAKILENIQDPDNIGSHLFYSFFKNLEGVGVFKYVLQENGYHELKIVKNKKGEYEIDQYSDKKQYFAAYTGDVDKEIRGIILAIYNSRIEGNKNTTNIAKQLKGRNNYLGEIIKVLMITKAGATGIDLKNTRFVHICEPFWNITLIQQAVGRAKRLRSHIDLEEKYKTVKIYMYLSVFTKEQTKLKAFKTIMDFDRIETVPATTDEHLLWISFRKNEINSQFVDEIKKTSIDCDIYSSKEGVKCLSFGLVKSNDFTMATSVVNDEISNSATMSDLDDENNISNNVITKKIELRIITASEFLDEDGKLIRLRQQYVVDSANNVYDYEEYTDLDINGEPKNKLKLIGEIVVYEGDDYGAEKKGKRMIKIGF
jgi:superfamily II DNA or RNA helicase